MAKWATKIQKEYLMRHFSHESDRELAQKTRLTLRQVRYFAEMNGLKKSPERMSEAHREQAYITNRKRWKHG